MKKINTSIKLLFATTVLMSSCNALAFELSKPILSPSKLTDVWTGIKPLDLNDETTKSGLLPMSSEAMKKFDFELASRWDVLQVEPKLLAYRYLLENGINHQKTILNKFLGVTGIVFGYFYDVAPSFREGNYTRTDRYVTSPSLQLDSNIIEQGSNKLVAHVEPSYSVEFQFRRQFKDPKSAILSRPYFVQNLPLNAENTIQNLNPGDLFVFNAHLDILLGGDFIKSIGLLQNGYSIGAYGMITGGFQVHILRLPENKIRFKIFSSKNNSAGLTGNVGLFNVPDITHVDTIDNKIIEVVVGNTNLLSTKIEKTWNKSFMLDYVLDLNNSDVSRAFNEAMGQVREFNYMNAGDPRVGRTQYLKSTMTNVLSLEKLVKEGVITSAHKTMNNSEGSRWGLNVGNKILGFKMNGRSTVNKLDTTNAAGLNEKYKFTTKKDSIEFSFFYSLFNQSEKNMTGVLANEQPIGLIYSTEKTTRDFSERDLRSVEQQLELSLPETKAKTDFSNWRNSGKKNFKNVVTRTQVLIPVEAIQAIPALNRKEIAKVYMKYLAPLNMDEYLMKSHLAESETAMEKIERDVNNLSYQLEKVLSTKTVGDKKVKALIKLFDDQLFRMTGLGFIIKLVPEGDLKASIYAGFHMSATNGPVISQVSAPNEKLEFYGHVLSIDNLTNDEEIDMTIESEGVY